MKVRRKEVGAIYCICRTVSMQTMNVKAREAGDKEGVTIP